MGDSDAPRGDRSGEITELLAEIRDGRSEAVDKLAPLVYRELHSMAHRQLRRHRPGQTLNTTALVHEAYVRLVGGSRLDWSDRRHFMAVAATAMRNIVIDYARSRGAQKRGGDAARTVLDDGLIGFDPRAEELLILDQALERLGALDDKLVKLVELRFFAGLTVDETAKVLDVSPRTVKRDWAKARGVLSRLLENEPGS